MEPLWSLIVTLIVGVWGMIEGSLGGLGMPQTCFVDTAPNTTTAKFCRTSRPLVLPRGSIYTTIMESGPKRPSPLWFWGPNSIMVVYMDPLGYIPS